MKINYTLITRDNLKQNPNALDNAIVGYDDYVTGNGARQFKTLSGVKRSLTSENKKHADLNPKGNIIVAAIVYETIDSWTGKIAYSACVKYYGY